jgi:hypothetical protein
MAPRARIAAYKVCWLYVGSALAGCFPSDSVAAIDQAVADGVDVINFSISGTRTNYLDAVEVSFFFAADAGVFVAASAGNEGPGNTVAHMSPWITTVAASTHDRLRIATATLGDGSTYSGASLQNSGLSVAPLILSTEAGVLPLASLSSVQQAALRLCFDAVDLADASLLGSAAGPNAALDPAKTTGKIVVCDRGTNARVNKSSAVKDAGGVGMLLLNTSAAQTLNDDAHFVPAVHLASSARAAVRAYAAGAAGSASLLPSTQAIGVIAPVMADFSSRGPSLATASILKPDITAPGVNVLAAYAGDQPDAAAHAAIIAGAHPDPAYNFLQGTSMSSPHIAGIAALLRQLHPLWSPAAIKSALMTTTTGVKLASGAPDNDRFAYGAGHVNPNSAAVPGLVYDAGTPDYLAFLCGLGLLNPSGSTCSAVGFLSPWNLNLASLTAAEIVGKITLRRTVTNVGSSPATFTATASLPGFTVAVVPATLTLPAGGSGSFDVQLTRTSAALGSWALGSLAWNDGSTVVTSPLTARALAFTAPSLVLDARARGTKVFTVGTGYDGTLAASATGLVPATRTSGSVETGGDACFNFPVPAGALHARFRLYNSDTQGGSSSDLDLEVYRGSTLVGSSGSGTSDELVDLASPTPATYTACVIGYAPAGGLATFTLSTWVVGPAVGPQSLKVAAPSKVYLGGTASVGLSWSVPAGSRYLGVVQFKDGASTPLGTTLVGVDVP